MDVWIYSSDGDLLRVPDSAGDYAEKAEKWPEVIVFYAELVAVDV